MLFMSTVSFSVYKSRNIIFIYLILHFFLVRQLLLCRVALGKSFLQFSAMKMAHAPPGHHSVIGRPSAGGLHFPEYVVYRGEQVSFSTELCPAFDIMYLNFDYRHIQNIS